MHACNQPAQQEGRCARIYTMKTLPRPGVAGNGSLQQACMLADDGKWQAQQRTWTMGRRSPTTVCNNVIQPDMKKMVPMTCARSTGVPPIAPTNRKGMSTVAPSMVK